MIDENKWSENEEEISENEDFYIERENRKISPFNKYAGGIHLSELGFTPEEIAEIGNELTNLRNNANRRNLFDTDIEEDEFGFSPQERFDEIAKTKWGDCYLINERISKYFEQAKEEKESEICRSECKNCKIYCKFRFHLYTTPDRKKLKVKRRLTLFKKKNIKICIKCLEKKMDKSNWFEKAMKELHITENFLNGFYEELTPITREVLDNKDFEDSLRNNNYDYVEPPCFNLKPIRKFYKKFWKNCRGD